jgi:hypothetical protein
MEIIIYSNRVFIVMPVIYQRLTERTLATGVTKDDLIHIVITGDTSQDPDGSSYKAKISQVFDSITGYCFTDLYVSNIHSCSPLNINPLDEGNVYFGSTSGITIDVINKRIGVNTDNPDYELHIIGDSFIDGNLTANTISATTYYNLPSTSGLYLPLSGGTVTGGTIFTSGLTATTLNISSTPTTDTGTTTNVLVRDVSTGVIKQRDITSTLNKNYASFYDTGDQTGLANTVLTMSANTSDSWNTGITLSANTRFVIQNPGVYNLAFSAQMVKTGGNSSTHAHIWLYQNGLDVLYSASQIGFPSNSVYVVPAWNFFFSTTTPNEYVELKWEINSNVDNQLSLKQQPATGSVPAIPSLIVTINQVN